MFHLFYNRKTTRLPNYDYSKNGFYFVTICAWERKKYFGEIINGKIELNEIGKMVKQYWEKIPQHFENIFLDKFVIMPNHVHGIVVIERDSPSVGTRHVASLRNIASIQINKFGPLYQGSLSTIIHAFKASVTRESRRKKILYKIWQRSFHDHIIRNDLDLMRIREYIQNNPRNWEMDENFQ